MEIEFSDRAIQDRDYWKKSGNITVQKKISRLLESIKESPFEGIGKPEPLKHELSGKWSRRITQRDRMVYEVADKTIRIYSLRGHYH